MNSNGISIAFDEWLEKYCEMRDQLNADMENQNELIDLSLGALLRVLSLYTEN